MALLTANAMDQTTLNGLRRALVVAHTAAEPGGRAIGHCLLLRAMAELASVEVLTLRALLDLREVQDLADGLASKLIQTFSEGQSLLFTLE